MLVLNSDIKQKFWPDQMNSTLNIAVAGFAADDSSLDQLSSYAGSEIARKLTNELNRSPSSEIAVWGPDRVGTIRGRNDDEHTASAVQRAGEINAHLVIYGHISRSADGLIVTPEFYLINQTFFASQEIVGQYQFGAPIHLSAYDDATVRVLLAEELSGRTRALASISTGLALALDKKYDKAREAYQAALNSREWQEPQGKQVIYILLGNLDLLQKHYESAAQYYQQALNIDPDYARPYIGLGNIAYSRALDQAINVNHYESADAALLNEAEHLFYQAGTAAHRPPLSDIESKVHYGLGEV